MTAENLTNRNMHPRSKSKEDAIVVLVRARLLMIYLDDRWPGPRDTRTSSICTARPIRSLTNVSASLRQTRERDASFIPNLLD